MEAQRLTQTIVLICLTKSTDNTALGGWIIHERQTIHLQTNSDDSVSLKAYKLGASVCMCAQCMNLTFYGSRKKTI